MQVGTGAAVAAWHDRRWVVDLWGGAADAKASRHWERDSIVQPYSVAKPFAAICALRLVDQRRLDLDAPMQHYWPEFRAEATIRQVLSHQAGVVAIDQPQPTDVFYDWDRMCDLLARQKPTWTPGTALGESALFFGHLIGEVVRRIAGRSLGHFLRDEVCGPLGLDFGIGLTPAEQARAVDLTGLTDAFREQNASGKPALFRRAIGNPPGAQDAKVVNGRQWRGAEVPAVNGHGTARGVAGLYAALLQGQLLSAALLEEATRTQCSGPDLVMGDVKSWGLGFGIDPSGFGMGGLGGSVGWACPAGRYAFGFVTGAVGTHDRGTLLENAVRSCIGMPPLD
jgi:CubicO group peptidase (beta-lactamase class C family)